MSICSELMCGQRCITRSERGEGGGGGRNRAKPVFVAVCGPPSRNARGMSLAHRETRAHIYIYTRYGFDSRRLVPSICIFPHTHTVCSPRHSCCIFGFAPPPPLYYILSIKYQCIRYFDYSAHCGVLLAVYVRVH